MKKTHKKAFTLAEILSVLILIGIIASITSSTALNNTIKRSDRTKVAKAISTYNQLIQNFTIQNNLNISTAELNKYARYNKMTLPPSIPGATSYTEGLKIGTTEYTAAIKKRRDDLTAYNNLINSGECENIRKYIRVQSFTFKDKRTHKTTQMPTKCMFKAGDLWWDMTNISSTIIALKPETLVTADGNKNDDITAIASDYGDNRAFYLTTIRNKEIGAYLTNNTTNAADLLEKVKIEKAHDFAFNKQTSQVLPCTEKRTADCITFVKNVGIVYFNKKGERAYQYKECDKFHNCDCEYKKIETTASGEYYVLTGGDKEKCLEYSTSGGKKHACPIIYESYTNCLGGCGIWQCEGINLTGSMYKKHKEYIDKYLTE